MLRYAGRAVLIGLSTVLPELAGDPTKEMISLFIDLISSRPVDRVNPPLASLAPAMREDWFSRPIRASPG
ncbi:hypothetical protein [Aureimonas leprariae]|uniref:hypothetical protein n=1 Tax=Plantimonas leprariae TaxID=2615207 RepID=UPI00138700B1|nr:hypothetical protein [Aureimonas leprariae]